MDFTSLNTFICIFLVLIFAKGLLNSIISKGKKNLPPGPPALPFIGHVHLLNGPAHHSLLKISKQYGPIVSLRFGSRPVLLVSNHTLADQCFTTHDLAFSNRTHLPTIKMASNLIVWANYGPYWRNIRQTAATELLSSQQLNASSHIRAEEFKSMVRQEFMLYQSQQSKESNSFIMADIRKLLSDLMMNIMLITIAGMNNEGSEDLKAFSKALTEWFGISGPSNLEDYIPLLRILDLNGVIKKTKNFSKVSQEMVQKMIEEHRQEGIGKRKSMIGRLLELQKKDSEKYNDQVIRGIVVAMMLGGTETIGTTVEWAMVELLNNPEVLEKAAAEIDARIGDERLVQESDMSNLPYINSIISEIFRLHPATPLLVPHEAREDIKLEGYDIPKGTMLIVNIYPIQRDPELWEEPDKFNPIRFMDGSSKGKMVIPFGMGRRRCPGEPFATRATGVLLGTLIQCFEWKRLSNELIDLTESSGLTAPLATAPKAMYRPRRTMKKLLSEL